MKGTQINIIPISKKPNKRKRKMTQADRLYAYILSCGRPGPTHGELAENFRFQIINITDAISQCRAKGKPIACDHGRPARYYIAEPVQGELKYTKNGIPQKHLLIGL